MNIEGDVFKIGQVFGSGRAHGAYYELVERADGGAMHGIGHWGPAVFRLPGALVPTPVSRGKARLGGSEAIRGHWARGESRDQEAAGELWLLRQKTQVSPD